MFEYWNGAKAGLQKFYKFKKSSQLYISSYVHILGINYLHDHIIQVVDQLLEPAGK